MIDYHTDCNCLGLFSSITFTGMLSRRANEWGHLTYVVIFIRAMDIEPSKLCHYVLSDLQKSASKRTRYENEMMSLGNDSVHWRSLVNTPIHLNKFAEH